MAHFMPFQKSIKKWSATMRNIKPLASAIALTIYASAALGLTGALEPLNRAMTHVA